MRAKQATQSKEKKTKTVSETSSVLRKKRHTKSTLNCSRGELKRLTYVVGIKKSTKGLIELLDEVITSSIINDVRKAAMVMDKKTQTLSVNHLLLSRDTPMIGFN